MLALHQQAFVYARELVGNVQDGGKVGRALLLHVALGVAALHAVLAGRRQAQWRQEAVDGVDLAARHDGERAAELVAQVAQEGNEGRRDLDGFRRGREPDECSVEVEKEG